MPKLLPDKLTETNIVGIRTLSPGHPVFKLIWNGGETGNMNFTVKWETVKPETLEVVYGLMRDVARGTRARVLSTGEVGAIYKLAQKSDTAVVEDEAAKYIKSTVIPHKGDSTWVLMHFKDGLTELDKVCKDADAKKAFLILSSLKEREKDKDKDNLSRLGKILAVDMFTHNTDRFTIKPSTFELIEEDKRVAKRKGKPAPPPRGIENLGNVFFVDKGDGRFRIKGLDPFMVSAEMAHLDQTVQGVKEEGPGWWSGILLRDEKRMKQIAQMACDSLNHELGTAAGKVYDGSVLKQYKLGDDDVKAVFEAMKAARDKIKACCLMRIAQAGGRQKPSQGLMSRVVALSWK